MRVSPTQRSLKALRDEGYTAAVVERWNAHVSIRQDFCGGIDLIAFRAPLGQFTLIPILGVGEPYRVGGMAHARLSGEILGVQCCAASGLAAHRKKLLAEPRMREWVAAGGRLLIHSWGKRGPRGRRKLWACHEEELTLADFDTPPVAIPDAVSGSEIGNLDMAATGGALLPSGTPKNLEG